VEVCKKQILETTENTDRRKALVSRLIKLRIRLQDLKDRQERQGENLRPFPGADPRVTTPAL
jgi:hypothetical protein